MCSKGVDENEITCDADDFTKFLRFAEMLPKAIGKPMYLWCHLELKRYFYFDRVLNGDTSREVYDLCNQNMDLGSIKDINEQDYHKSKKICGLLFSDNQSIYILTAEIIDSNIDSIIRCFFSQASTK